MKAFFSLLPLVLLLLPAGKKDDPQRISWEATVLAAPEIHTQAEGAPPSCPPIALVHLTVNIEGNPYPLRATCTADAGHEAHCLCAGLAAGDVVRIEDLSLNHFYTYPGGISVYWPEIDRISVVSLAP